MLPFVIKDKTASRRPRLMFDLRRIIISNKVVRQNITFKNRPTIPTTLSPFSLRPRTSASQSRPFSTSFVCPFCRTSRLPLLAKTT